jgi:hypothetical protein
MPSARTAMKVRVVLRDGEPITVACRQHWTFARLKEELVRRMNRRKSAFRLVDDQNCAYSEHQTLQGAGVTRATILTISRERVVRVLLLSGQEHTVSCHSSDSVVHLEHCLAKQTGWPWYDHCLLSASGEQLKDYVMLRDAVGWGKGPFTLVNDYDAEMPVLEEAEPRVFIHCHFLIAFPHLRAAQH